MNIGVLNEVKIQEKNENNSIKVEKTLQHFILAQKD